MFFPAQAALTLAAPVLDAHLQAHPTVGKMLVKVQPRSPSCPAPPVYDKVRPGDLLNMF